MSNYVKISFEELRNKILNSGLNEDEFREELYKDNPESKKSDKGLGNLIYQISFFISNFLTRR